MLARGMPVSVRHSSPDCSLAVNRVHCGVKSGVNSASVVCGLGNVKFQTMEFTVVINAQK